MRLVRTCLAAALIAAASAGAAWAQHAPPAPRAPVTPRPPAAAAPAPHATPAARTWSRYQNATEVQLRDVAAYVRVLPENRADIAVSVTNRGPLEAPQLSVRRGRLTIDGQLRRKIRSCRVDGAEGFDVDTTTHGQVSDHDLPVIELRVPQDVEVSASGAMRIHVGSAEAVSMRLDGCGDVDVVRVNGAAEISVNGDSDVRLYEAGSAEISVAGAGDVTLGAVRSGLAVSIAGTGDVIAARADGPTNLAVQGIGDITIRDGRATALSVVIAGSGDVTHNGVADRLDAVIIGGGDVRVRRVTGQVTRRVLGGGDVVVGR